MTKKLCKLSRDRLGLYVSKLTIEIYWPALHFGKDYNKSFGFVAKTMILFTRPRNWAWHTAFVFTVLGFGIGGAWNHVDNPSYVNQEAARA